MLFEVVPHKNITKFLVYLLCELVLKNPKQTFIHCFVWSMFVDCGPLKTKEESWVMYMHQKLS